MAMLRNDTLTGMVKKLKMPNLNTNGIITLITAMMMSAHTKNAILAFLFGATILLSPVLLLCQDYPAITPQAVHPVPLSIAAADGNIEYSPAKSA